MLGIIIGDHLKIPSLNPLLNYGMCAISESTTPPECSDMQRLKIIRFLLGLLTRLSRHMNTD